MTYPSFSLLARRSSSSLVALAVGLGAASLGGCGLSADPPFEPTSNTCSATADCGAEGVCVETQDLTTRCVAKSADLGAVIIEVRPTGGDASYVFFDAVNVVGQSDNGLLQDLDLVLPQPVQVTGRLLAPDGLPSACQAGDGTLPVNVRMVRSADFGPFSSKFEKPGAIVAAPSGSTTTAAFTLGVPPGTYDLYLEPQRLPDPGCESAELPPPRLVSDIVIEEGKPFDYSENPDDAPKMLAGSVIVPVDTVLDGWVLDVVDPTHGYVISEPFFLSAPIGDSLPIEGFSYQATEGALLRLQDSTGNLSVHWALSVLDLNSDGIVEIDLRDLVTTPMPVDAHIIDSSGALIASAGVTIKSLALTGSANQNANYRIETRTDATGSIAVNLVEGTYAVTIVPDEPGSATYFGEWEVTENGSSGKGFELSVQPTMSGVVTDPSGIPLASAPVAVGPSQSSASDYFTQALLDLQPLKRQFAVSTDASGAFSLFVDPGEIDLAVQMTSESGYPWLVLPSFKVDAAEQTPLVDLGDLQLRYPVMLQGKVSDAAQDLSFAIVRAWVRGASLDGTGPLIQVGATTTDATGGFILPVPPGITITEAAPADSSQ